MSNFRRKITSLRNPSVKKKLALCMVIFVIPFILWCVGSTEHDMQPVDFYPMDDAGVFAKLDVIVLDGPFAAEYVGGLDRNYYIARTTAGYYCIIAAYPNADLPIALSDIESYASAAPHTVYGTSAYIEGDVLKYLLAYLTMPDGSHMSEDEYVKFFGICLLDTTVSPYQNSVAYYAVAVSIAFIGIVWRLILGFPSRKLAESFDKTNKNGALDRAAEDFADTAHPMYRRMPSAAVSNHYFIGVDTQNVITVIFIPDIQNVYCSYMLNGEYSTTAYIAIELYDGRRIYTSPCPRGLKSLSFAAVIKRLKKQIAEGGCVYVD